jgi:hypothetical protein
MADLKGNPFLKYRPLPLQGKTEFEKEKFFEHQGPPGSVPPLFQFD